MQTTHEGWTHCITQSCSPDKTKSSSHRENKKSMHLAGGQRLLFSQNSFVRSRNNNAKEDLAVPSLVGDLSCCSTDQPSSSGHSHQGRASARRAHRQVRYQPGHLD